MNPAELSTATDDALVQIIAARNASSELAEVAERAMAEVFNRYGATVGSMAFRVLGDRSLADDVTQEVLLGLWRNAERFDPTRGKLRTLLLTQAHGRSVDVIRSRNARQAREEKVTTETPPAFTEVDAELMAITEAESVRAALAQLSPEERAAIELAYFGANTYRQVAVLLDLPEGTVKGRIRSGLKRLHGLLTESPPGLPYDYKQQPYEPPSPTTPPNHENNERSKP